MDVRKKLSSWFDWFVANQDELVSRYGGKYIVIKDCNVVASFDNEDEAYFTAKKEYGLGNFLVQLCISGDEAYSMRINTPYIYGNRR